MERKAAPAPSVTPHHGSDTALLCNLLTLNHSEAMVTISEDFLNSLPADKRAEFLNATFEMLSMNPSDQDEIMAQNIRRLYEGHQGKVIKCSFCRKDEPDDQEFGRMFINSLQLQLLPSFFSF